MLLSHPEPGASHSLEHRVGLLEAHGKNSTPTPLHKVTQLTSPMACLEIGGPCDSHGGASPAPVHPSARGVLGLELLSRPSPPETCPRPILLSPSSSLNSELEGSCKSGCPVSGC
ncbi:hypothetical protein VULLAG_LOCUS7798 [Vulpes lagopus]